MTASETEEELPVREGPDPQHWTDRAPQLWSLLLDLEHLGRALAVLNGPVSQDVAGTHFEAVRFVRESAMQLRADLAAEIVRVYGLDDDAPAEQPYSGSGKARAYGAERPPATE